MGGRTSSAGGRRGRSGLALYGAVLAILAASVYINALHNPFVYDDRDTVASNPSIVDPSNVRFLLAYSPFRPVVNLSYALDRAVWGAGPFGFHLTNLALHVTATLLLFGIAVQLVGETQAGPRAEASRLLAASGAAAVFAAHPLLTEAVGYISGRSEVLCAVWFAAAFLAAARAMRLGSVAWGLTSAACGLLALFSKENAAALPVVLLAYDWLVRPGTDAARRRRLWLLFLPIVVVGALGAAYRVLSLSAVSVGPAPLPPTLNALTQAIVIWRYVGLLLWPAGQSIMHGVHRVDTLSDPMAWAAVAGLAAVITGAMTLGRRAPLVPFAAIWFFAAIAPSSSFVALREGMAEHRVYLAALGATIALADVLCRLMSAPAPGRRRTVMAALAVAVVALATATVARNRVWSSPVRLWTEATESAPDQWEPQYALGDALREAGNCQSAIAPYERVVAVHPDHRDALTNLGICLAQTGHYTEAEQAFRRTLTIDPTFVRGYTNLGALALVAGDPERARDYYREAIAQDPGNVLARLQLAKLYEATFNDYRAAARMCGEARALAPATPGLADCVDRNERLAAAAGR